MKNKKKQRLENLQIAAFCDQLAMIVTAGIPVYEGVSILVDDAPDKETEEVLRAVYTPLISGSSLHEAMTISGYFPKYVLDMIELGEISGKLEDVLLSLRSYYEREESIRSGIKNAVTYPILMIFIMLAILIVMIAKVIPVFNQIYAELGTSLTGFSLSMMNFSTHLNQYLGVVIVLLIVCLLLFFCFFRSHLGKIFFQGKGLALSISASRFANCMFLAINSGLDTTQGMEFALRLTDNPHMAERIRRCNRLMESGQGFPESILAAGIFSKLYASLITIGFKTGSMDEVMDKISKSYEEEINTRIGHFISILEPTLVIIMSIVIGIILISFLLPLIGIMSSIG